ncbi:MAG: hypothetical protein ABEJ66_00680 [Candidatus Nanohaloarchaea archaeon]
MTNFDPVELVLEHGPEGNLDTGKNCAVYQVGDRYVKLNDRLTEEDMDRFTGALDSAGISYPETFYEEVEVPVYGIGDVLVIEQSDVGLTEEYFLGAEEDEYVQDIRELGLKAAGNGIKLDFGLENLYPIGEEIGVVDINDPEAIWLEEDMALHLMGSHLLNSIERLERTENFHSPHLRQMAYSWKQSV